VLADPYVGGSSLVNIVENEGAAEFRKTLYHNLALPASRQPATFHLL